MSKISEIEQKQTLLHPNSREYANLGNDSRGLFNRVDYLVKKLKKDLERPISSNVSKLEIHIKLMQYEIDRDRQFLQKKYDDCRALIESTTELEEKIKLRIELKSIDHQVEEQEKFLAQKKSNMLLKIKEKDNIISVYNDNFTKIFNEIFEISGKTKEEILREFEAKETMQKDIVKIEKEAEEATRQALAKIEKEKETKKNRLKMFKRVG